MSRAEHARFTALVVMGCILCRHLGTPGTPPEIHHIRSGQGMGQRAKYNLTIPMCPYHHRGQMGYHGLGKRAFEAAYGVTEIDLLDMTDALIGGGVELIER